jgi:uncharacterized protein (DUF1919 family)
MLNILYIGATDFVYNRGINGSSHELDFIVYLNNHTKQTHGYSSTLIFSDDFEQIEGINPDIIYIFDCDKPRNHFCNAIEYANRKKIPIVLISNDLFHYNLVRDEPNTLKLNGILSTVRMKRLTDQYKRDFPDKYISGIPTPFINTNQFTDWGMEKIYDICIFGQTDLELPPLGNCIEEEYFEKNCKGIPEMYPFYPLRQRLTRLLLNNTERYNIKYIPTPLLSCWACPIKGVELSRIINQSYLTLSTRSRSDRCMQKYFEITASNSFILGDIPTDYMDLFTFNSIVVDMNMSDETILGIIDDALKNKETILQQSKDFGEFIRSEYGLDNKNTITDFLKINREIIGWRRNAYISNTCSNIKMYSYPYNHPFIGSLFVNDEQYVRFCKNFNQYILKTPVFAEPDKDSVWAKQSGDVWYKHPSIEIPYVVMYLGNIEIHWVHEHDEEALLQKYKRRLQRYYDSEPSLIFLLSCSELLNDHSDDTLVKDFLSIPTSYYITKTPSREIFHEPWACLDNKRNDYHVYEFNNQDTIVDVFKGVFG